MSLKHLWRLQQLELAKEKAAKQLNKDIIKQLASEKEALLARQEEIMQEKLEWQKLLKDKKHQEEELKKLEARKKDLSRELYSGQVTNLKELSHLEEQVYKLDGKIDSLVETYLKLEEKAQEMENNIKTKFDNIVSDTEAYKQKARSVKEERDIRKAELASLKKAIQEAESLITPSILAQYRRVQQRLGIAALAQVKNGVCGGCGIKLPSSLWQQVKRQELIKCESCGRILLTDDNT